MGGKGRKKRERERKREREEREGGRERGGFDGAKIYTQTVPICLWY